MEAGWEHIEGWAQVCMWEAESVHGSPNPSPRFKVPFKLHTYKMSFQYTISMNIKTCKLKPDTQTVPVKLARNHLTTILMVVPSIDKSVEKQECSPLTWEIN